MTIIIRGFDPTLLDPAPNPIPGFVDVGAEFAHLVSTTLHARGLGLEDAAYDIGVPRIALLRLLDGGTEIRVRDAARLEAWVYRRREGGAA